MGDVDVDVVVVVVDVVDVDVVMRRIFYSTLHGPVLDSGI